MIEIPNMDEVEKAKILLNPKKGEVLKVSKVYNIFLRAMTINVDMSNGHSLDVNLSFTVMGDSEVPQLDPNKQYIIAEVE